MSKPNKNVQFAEGLHEQQMKYAPDQVDMAAAAGRTEDELHRAEVREMGVMDEQFPTEGLTAYDPLDKEAVARIKLGDGKGVTPFGRMIAEDKYFKWVQKKEAAAEKANFQAWFAREFDLMSPAQKKWAKEKYPEFYAERKKLLKKQAKNLFDLARIKLEGIESYKDLVKTYMAETGRLDLGPLENLLNPEATHLGLGSGIMKKTSDAIFVRGLASPFMFFGKEAYPATYESRKGQSQRYANRDMTGQRDGEIGAGIKDSTFPGFAGNATNQGDAQWYQLLTKKI